MLYSYFSINWQCFSSELAELKKILSAKDTVVKIV
jgi:hypothetical protein